MKKNTLLLLSVVLCFAATAQVPNGDFESWTKSDREVISGWNSQGKHTKVAGPTNGDNAIRLETDDDENISVVAYVDFGEDLTNLKGGFAYKGGKPVKIRVNMRYDIPVGDTAAIIVSASLLGQAFSLDLNRITGKQSTFIDVDYTINYYQNFTPDSFVVGFTSGSLDGNPIAGGWLEVSNVEFIDGNGAVMADIPNGDFETWETISSFTLDGWNTSSDFLRAFGSDIENVVRSDEKSSGKYGLYLQTIELGGEDTISGIAFTSKSKNDFELEDPAFPVDMKYLSLQGRYKYKPVGNDSFTVNAILYFQGSIVASCQFKEGATKDKYTYFSKDFTYATPLTPDSALVAIFSSDIDNPISVGSELWVDEITFKEWTTGVKDIENSHFTLYPNPAKESINVEVTANSQVMLISNNGQLVQQFDGISGVLNINTSQLPKGIYYVEVNSKNQHSTQKLIIQ